MLHGVLNIPSELWDSSNPFDSMQRQSRYVEASKLIYKQADRIAELEKEKASHVPVLAWIARECNQVDGVMLHRFKSYLEILKLEQQALACDWIYTKLPNYQSENLSVITARRLELVTQANALRGNSERPQNKS